MKSLAKKLTLSLLALAFIMGCVISFFPAQVAENYKMFLGAYAPFFIIMIGSIGLNSAITKIKKTNTEVADDTKQSV